MLCSRTPPVYRGFKYGFLNISVCECLCMSNGHVRKSKPLPFGRNCDHDDGVLPRRRLFWWWTLIIIIIIYYSLNQTTNLIRKTFFTLSVSLVYMNFLNLLYFRSMCSLFTILQTAIHKLNSIRIYMYMLCMWPDTYWRYECLPWKTHLTDEFFMMFAFG